MRAELRHTLLTLCTLLTIAAHPAESSVDLGGGLLLDTSRAQLIVPRPEGGIAAHALADGAKRWATSKADRPVLIDGDRCLAQRRAVRPGELLLATIDLTDGTRLARSRNPLPSTVTAGIYPHGGARFRLEPSAVSGVKRLIWRYDARDAKAPRALSQRGVLALDVPSARAAPVDAQAPDIEPFEARRDVMWLGERRRVYLSADQAHVLTSEPTAVDGKRAYRWRIYDRDERRIASLVESRPYAPFVVSDERLVIVDRGSLRAGSGFAREVRVRMLAAGDIAWRLDVGDLLSPRDASH